MGEATMIRTLSTLVAITALTMNLGATVQADSSHDPSHGLVYTPGVSSPLIDKVRRANDRFKDFRLAMTEGWVPGTPCVSGPDHGAMGVHFIKMSLIQNGVLDAEQPEALIYEPEQGGGFRLVGAEFIVLVATWQSKNPGKGPPNLEGNLLNLVGSPNRYGLDPFYEIHVWAWQENPSGNLSDWNNHVTCEQQPVSN
jgi:hypothetical protein